MRKTIKLLESDIKKFNRYIGNFNRILRKNNLPDLVYDMKPEDHEVRIHRCIYEGYGAYREDGEVAKIRCSGFTVDIEIPEEILKVGDHQYIGQMFLVDGIWQKHFVSKDNPHNNFVSEQNFRCDHCKAKISTRKGYLFFVDNEGKEVVVGRSCAKAYFGYDVEEIIKAISNFDIYDIIRDAEEYDEECFGFTRDAAKFDLAWFIPVTAYFTHDFTKWEKKEVAIGETFGTGVKVKGYFDKFVQPDKDTKFEDISNYIKKYSDIDFVEKVKKYWADKDATTDFTYNCQQIVRNGWVSRRWIGYAVWAIFEALQVKVEQNNLVIGEYVGELKKRDVFTLTITEIKEDHTSNNDDYYFGSGCNSWQEKDSRFLKIKFDDENGNHFQTNCYSAKMIEYFERKNGQKVSIKGTIVRYFERKNGEKVNFISRVVLA